MLSGPVNWPCYLAVNHPMVSQSSTVLHSRHAIRHPSLALLPVHHPHVTQFVWSKWEQPSAGPKGDVQDAMLSRGQPPHSLAELDCSSLSACHWASLVRVAHRSSPIRALRAIRFALIKRHSSPRDMKR